MHNSLFDDDIGQSRMRCQAYVYIFSYFQAIPCFPLVKKIILITTSLPVGCVWTTRQFVLLWLCASD